MKFLVAIAMVVVVGSVQALTVGQLERLVHNHAVCARQVTIDPEIISQVRHGEYIDSKPLRDYLFCLGKRAGFVDDDGQIQRDALLEWTAEAVGETLANELVGACAVTTETGPDSTYRVVRCIHDKSGAKLVNII